MQPGIPGSAPPSTAYPNSGYLGPQAGVQAKEKWPRDGATDERQVLSAIRAPHLWRVTLQGKNVVFRVSWGTSSNIVIKDVQPPALFVVPGSCDVYASPVDLLELGDAFAGVTCTPATSGVAAVMRVRHAGPNAPFDVNAARFVALQASVVQVGEGGIAVNVNLAVLQSVLLTAGSVLISGAGYQEFEP